MAPMEMELHLHSVNDAQDVHSSDAERPLIPLRLPVALLSNLTAESRLVINHDGDGKVGAVDGDGDGGDKPTTPPDDNAMSLTIDRKGMGNDQSADTYQLEVDQNSEQRTDWYQSAIGTTSGSSSTNKNELHHIGTTTKQYIIKPKSKTELKEIGRRTRRVLEEERKKRKEIVRLDDDDECLVNPEKKKMKKAAVSQTPQPKPSEDDAKKKKPTPKKTERKSKSSSGTKVQKRKRRVASNVDGWMPNVDNLLSTSLNSTINTTAATSGKEDHRSNIVRLHGLPVGVKPEHIRKVFHGLNPSLIFVLPSFACPIRGWDVIASSSGADDGKQSIIVKRHPSDFRVFVKFTSAPVANAAIERSGESIGFDKQEGIIMGSQTREIVGAAISMSPVPKNIATFLLKYMAIHTRKGEPIMETLARSEKQLGTISQMSWQMAMKQLNLKRQIIRKGMKWNSYNLDYLSHKHMIPTNISQYQTLAKMYNRLIDAHEKLESDCSLLFTHAFDPSCMEDSVHRITQLVSNWILDEIYMIGRILNESRHRLKL